MCDIKGYQLTHIFNMVNSNSIKQRKNIVIEKNA